MGRNNADFQDGKSQNKERPFVMTTQALEPMATVHDYPRGLMNTCDHPGCGQVVLAPKLRHDTHKY